MIRILPFLATALAACAPQAPGGETPSQAPAGDVVAPPPAADQPAASACDASKAQFAVGQAYTAALAEQARKAAGAAVARRLMPGQAVTMEFNEQRLNLDTDEKGVVTGVNCG